MANPWSKVLTPATDSLLHPAHVIAFADRRQRANDKSGTLQKKTKKTYALREKDFVTYNYTEGRGCEDDNTLSNILVRAMQRKTKRKEIDEAMKMKRLQETKMKAEEEKRRCQEAKFRQESKLREMKEMHQLKILKEEQWRAREARQARNNKLADTFNKTRLLRDSFRGFRKLIEMSKVHKIKAKNHYREKILQRVFSKLLIHSSKEIQWRDQVATHFYEAWLLQKYFAKWKEEKTEKELQMAKATRHHQQCLLRRALWTWRWKALDLILQHRANSLLASQHYFGKLLAYSLLTWKHYTRTKRSRRWRDAVGTNLRGLVKDIVPDFSPSSCSDDDDDNDSLKCPDWMMPVLDLS
ncbi:coiled-coil domain-containing protein 191-like [Portunus trituberculatus]|uniref:coiled-coil domain-containing protein 191-like n=1 Tax=Portunus trituberculatus TaxID=210409 RepID=UPI001E1CE71C|nr:coiled-coil domain-containing protein 191-like [Portunus trituberculatus]